MSYVEQSKQALGREVETILTVFDYPAPTTYLDLIHLSEYNNRKNSPFHRKAGNKIA